MEEKEKLLDEIMQRLDKIELLCQSFDTRINKLEEDTYETGVFLDGCTEADIEYITGKTVKKEGE